MRRSTIACGCAPGPLAERTGGANPTKAKVFEGEITGVEADLLAIHEVITPEDHEIAKDLAVATWQVGALRDAGQPPQLIFSICAAAAGPIDA